MFMYMYVCITSLEYPNLHHLTKELVTLYKSLLSCYTTDAYTCTWSKPTVALSREHIVLLTAMSMGNVVAISLAKPANLLRKAEVRGSFFLTLPAILH